MDPLRKIRGAAHIVAKPRILRNGSNSKGPGDGEEEG